MEQTRNYATKKKGKTEVYPFWNLMDIKNLIDWFEDNDEWDGYLISMLEALLGRRISDTISLKWSDLYYENGNEREEITTITEKKTGKTVEIPIGALVFESIHKYCKKVNVNPMEHYNEFIFSFPSKTEWINREGDRVYLENDLEKWCKCLNKDFSNKRKESIITDFNKQRNFKTLGEYLYYEVEWSDVVKWHTDAYRRVFNRAVKSCEIKYRVSTHSFRKSFGYWIFKLHPFDPDVLVSLQKLFGHATVQQTEDYIGLTKEKNKKFIDDYNKLLTNVLNGEVVDISKNMPVISLKREDYGSIIMDVINKTRENTMSDMEIYNMAINTGNDLMV